MNSEYQTSPNPDPHVEEMIKLTCFQLPTPVKLFMLFSSADFFQNQLSKKLF